MKNISRRNFLKTAAGTAAMLGLFVLGGWAKSSQSKMNVLFIAVDDLRPQLGCYGHNQMISPNIDKLASEGMLFERAYCQQAICSPSRISLLSGMRCETTKIYGLEHRLAKQWPDIVSLPHHFKNNGYTTISIGKIYHHNDDPKTWSKAPFRALKERGYVTEEAKKIAELNKAANPNAGEKGPVTEMADVPDNSYSDGKLEDRAIEELGKIKNEPFFLAVGFRKPHLPFTAPKKYWDLYDPEELTLASNPYPPKGVTPFTMSAYGELRKYYKMPKGKEPVNDKLAKSSTVFQNAHCQAPICGPSRASLMTGLRPSTTGIYGQINDKDLRKDNTTMQEAVYLSEYFQKHGYKTMGVGKLFHKSDGAGAFEEYGGIFEKFGPKPKKRMHYDAA